MPFRKTRKAPRKAKTPFRRRPRKRLPMRRPLRNTHIHNFKKTDDLGLVTIAAGAGFVGFGFDFHLSDIGGELASFQLLFQSYRLMAVKWMVFPQYNTYNANIATVDIPEIITVVDFTKSDPPTVASDLFGYRNVRKQQLTRIHSRYFKPHARQDGIVISGGATTGTQILNRKIWLDTSDPTVEYFGIRGGIIGNTTSAVASSFRVITTYYFQFKNSH